MKRTNDKTLATGGAGTRSTEANQPKIKTDMNTPKDPLPLPAVACSVMDAEATLMKAATEFAYQWGRDQTVHPKMYWLELHMAKWRELAVAAVQYTNAIESQNV